jgi:hypothetical protein
LITMDYLLCLLLVFPALCIYDKWRHRTNWCCRCLNCYASKEVEEAQREDTEEKPSFIHRILNTFYDGIHKMRFFLVAACLGAFIISVIFAAKMDLPTSSDVRLLRSNNQFEMNYEWRLNILFEQLVKASGSTTLVIWGVKAADTGDHNNPESFTQLVLDDSFEPSNQEAQVYLRDFCGKMFENDWAESATDETCPINKFDEWLQEQSTSESPQQIYLDHCGGATGLPLAESDFDACIYHWGQMEREFYILARNGKVEIMFFTFRGRVRYDSAFEEIDKEWNTIEDWMNNERRTAAPASASGMYFTSEDYWWYDTNGTMLKTAYVAAAIAIATASTVILIFSRSVVLTIFSAYTIAYVLASVTAVLYAFGWTLGL